MRDSWDIKTNILILTKSLAKFQLEWSKLDCKSGNITYKTKNNCLVYKIAILLTYKFWFKIFTFFSSNCFYRLSNAFSRVDNFLLKLWYKSVEMWHQHLESWHFRSVANIMEIFTKSERFFPLLLSLLPLILQQVVSKGKKWNFSCLILKIFIRTLIPYGTYNLF